MRQVQYLVDGQLRPGAPGLALRLCPAVQLSLDRSVQEVFLSCPWLQSAPMYEHSVTCTITNHKSSQKISHNTILKSGRIFVKNAHDVHNSLAEQKLTARCVGRARVRAGASFPKRQSGRRCPLASTLVIRRGIQMCFITFLALGLRDSSVMRGQARGSSLVGLTPSQFLYFK